MDQHAILIQRLAKLTRHYHALQEYHQVITTFAPTAAGGYSIAWLKQLSVTERALLDAYLKRFASLQDYLGAKIFPLLMNLSGIVTQKMSDILIMVEREELIDSLSQWIELRELRNALEHDYPDDLTEALADLQRAISSFEQLQAYYQRVIAYAQRLIHPPL
ncbi:MAG: hypothetical protein HQL49_09030 [Gammaproteobacteria bacterium]|nr:hypothetical protein [Gammaproteobacteria bacterium]